MGIMTVGCMGGVLLTAKPVLRADEVDVWMHAYGTGAVLSFFGLALLPNAMRVAGGVVLAAMLALTMTVPSEIQSQQFAVALETAWKKGRGAGIYYKRTHGDMLDDEALDRLRKEADVEKPGTLVTLELLERLGSAPYGADGEGLLRTVDLLTSTKSKPFILPFFRQIQSVQCSGDGILHVAIKRRRGEEGAKFHVPGEKPGEKIHYWLTDDFTMRTIHEGSVWKLEFGPLTTTSAGIFEFNDTKQTPLRVQNVALWVDASVLGIIIEDHPDQLVVKAVAQGDIGDVKTVEIRVIPKEKRR
jgi:hypothetical protein